jgi:protocatechuate 3,4-dioxygenase beta subunit
MSKHAKDDQAPARPAHGSAQSRRIGRRRALERLAAVAGAAALGCGSDDESDAADQRSVSSLDEAPAASGAGGAAAASPPASVDEGPPEVAALDVPTSWDDVPTCAASNADGAGQGPFFIHDAERDDDIDLFRQDIRGRYDAAAEPGTELELHVRVLDGTSADCAAAPVAGIDVYIWHTDAQGYYSGFGEPGDQRPDEPYAGVPNQNDLTNTDRFCRGAQVTDENGVVSFRSIFPGWYNGRDIHVHFLATKRGSAARGRDVYAGGDHLFTTQFYFDPALTDRVHTASEPYLRRTALPAYEGSIQADEPGNSGLRAKAELDGGRVVAQIQILLPAI